MWMAEGRETNEWAQTFAIIGRISNLFADKDSRVDIMAFIPEHLRPDPAAKAEPSREEVKAHFDALRVAFQLGNVRQRG